MDYIVTGSQMHDIDAYTIKRLGVPSVQLMENASNAVVKEMKGLLSGTPFIVVLCGSGNNGGDGLAAARILTCEGIPASAAMIGNAAHATDEWHYQYDLAEKAGVQFIEDEDEILTAISRADHIVDAMLGTGLSREVSGRYADIIEAVNASPACVTAVDIPSGISSDTGAVMGSAVKADLTVTFQYRKLGQILYPGKDYCGMLVCADIGISDEGRKAVAPQAFSMDAADAAAFAPRPQYSNKGTFGRVLIAAGAVNMCGASYLSALAAYKSGAGLVEILAPEENRVILQTLIPEAVLTTYGHDGPGSELLKAVTARASSIVVGPGLGVNKVTEEMLTYFLSGTDKPLVIDADGLNTLAAHRDLYSELSGRVILTPHLKEFSRLSYIPVRDLQADTAAAARDFAAKYGCVLVLKDSATVVTDDTGRTYVNDLGNSGMATGGSGDVLSGVIGALYAAGAPAFDAAAYGVLIHAAAGDRAAEILGERAVMARDIADNIR